MSMDMRDENPWFIGSQMRVDGSCSLVNAEEGKAQSRSLDKRLTEQRLILSRDGIGGSPSLNETAQNEGRYHQASSVVKKSGGL